ncbi:Cobalt-zinc-cadmium resistance protein CzcC precursor [Rosistilla ulvae]|uniref:Cobalt-zinc-cadmium resistance protein CzcC n=1 Tax=Rosistilla ulvae TaxID=1930277 RepID=A0A517M0I4_9BACT|nr:TolC family protein [Rosistilla ulvae]QDS88376.1 Cobalt-zinc-cadmium resistance protein CzcC precursor [Rosistilla ulvae]
MRRVTTSLTLIFATTLTGCATTGKGRVADSSSASDSAPIASQPTPAAPADRKPVIATVAYRVEGEATADQQGPAVDQTTPVQESTQGSATGLTLAPAFIPENDFSPAGDGSVVYSVVDTMQPATAYTLVDIEQMALQNNPAIAEANAARSKAAGLRHQVGIRPNPTLGYSGQQLADEGTDQHLLFLEQEFVTGNKLGLNRAVLSHTASAQRWEIETQRYRVLTDVRVRFYEALASQQQLDATREFETVAKRGVEVARQRQEAEEGTLIEVLQAQTMLSEITLAAERSELAYRGAWQDLAAIAGLSAASPARLVAELNPPAAAPNWENAFQEIVTQSPEMSVANALVCEKAAFLKRQQVQMLPNITGQLGAGFDNGTDSGMLNVQFSAPIPVWNKNSGNISAAYADYRRAVENVKRIEQSIKSRLARTAQDFDSTIATVKKYEEEIIPQATKSLELSEEGYKAGELEFLQVLIVRRSFYDSMIRFIEAKGQLAQANAKVDGLLLAGGLDAPQDYTDGDGIRGASLGGQ